MGNNDITKTATTNANPNSINSNVHHFPANDVSCLRMPLIFFCVLKADSGRCADALFDHIANCTVTQVAATPFAPVLPRPERAAEP